MFLQVLAHFHNKYIFCSLLDQIYSIILDRGAELLLGKKINFEAWNRRTQQENFSKILKISFSTALS